MDTLQKHPWGGFNGSTIKGNKNQESHKQADSHQVQ